MLVWKPVDENDPRQNQPMVLVDQSDNEEVEVKTVTGERVVIVAVILESDSI